LSSFCAAYNQGRLTFFSLPQHGPASFDLRAILQECDNLQATSNKMMYKTTDS